MMLPGHQCQALFSLVGHVSREEMTRKGIMKRISASAQLGQGWWTQ